MDMVTYALCKKSIDKAIAGAGSLAGKSAYEIAVENGYQGTQTQWINSLKATPPTIGENGNWFIDGIDSGVSAASTLDELKFSNSAEPFKTSYAVGNIKLNNGVGTVNVANKTIRQIWNEVYLKEMNPTTTQPSVKLTVKVNGSSLTEPMSVEAGTKLKIDYTAALDAGKYSYGPSTGVTAQSYSISDTYGYTSTAASGTISNLVVADDWAMTAKIVHSAGATPVTNLGNTYSSGKIASGTKTATSKIISSYRNMYYGYADEIPTSSDAIKALAAHKNEACELDTLEEDTTKAMIVVAIPKDTIAITEVVMPSSSNANATSQFVKQDDTVMVSGKNNYSPIEYDIWVYSPAAMAGTYKITIG